MSARLCATCAGPIAASRPRAVFCCARCRYARHNAAQRNQVAIEQAIARGWDRPRIVRELGVTPMQVRNVWLAMDAAARASAPVAAR